MKKKIISIILLLSLILAALCSCEKKPERFSDYCFDYFDTATTIIGYAKSREAFDEVAAFVKGELSEYHRLYTIYHRYEDLENLCTINELSGGTHRTVKVDERIIDMLEFSRDAYDLTHGKVNIAMGSVLSIWHDYRETGNDEPWNATLPPTERLQEAAQHVDIDSLVIDRENLTVTLTDKDARLDVGAIAKGYAVEMIARSLEEKGVSGYVINVGGNVRTVGPKPDGEGWTVGIEDPQKKSESGYLEYLTLSSHALVTSGSYQRYYTVDGVDYHHIIDPDTLMPAGYFLSVSVVCPSSAMGDALSTALFCMPIGDGLALIESLEGTEAMWVDKDGARHYSSGFDRFIKK